MAEKALCYVRVSTEEQSRNGHSIQAQEAALSAYCAANGLQAEFVRDEGVSGSKPLSKRSGGAYLLDRAPTVGVVVITKLDRAFRDASDCLTTTKRWDVQGVRLLILDLSVDTSTPMGRFFISMASAFSELERNQIAERTRNVLEYRKSQGKAYSPVPYGLDRVGDDLVSNPDEEAVIERIKEMREQRLSFAKIAARLNAEGVPTKNGKKWHPYTVSYILKRLEKAA